MKRDRLRRRLGALSLALIGIVGISLALVFLLPSHWPADSIFVPRDVSTLMGALAEVGPGGTIVLQAGRGAFHGPVVVSTSGVTIAATGEVLVAGDGGEPAIAIRADGVTLDRLRISAPAIGVSIEGSKCRMNRISIDSTPIGIRVIGSTEGEFSSIRIEGGMTAIEVSSSVGSTFHDLTIVSPEDTGIALVDSRANLLTRVRISGGKRGISLEGSDGNEIRAVTIEDFTDAGVRFAGSNENTLSDGAIRGGETGVVIENAQGNRIEETLIRDVSTGCLLSQAVQNGIRRTSFVDVGGAAVVIKESRENAVSYCTLRGFGGEGISLIDSERSLILANAFAAGVIGIKTEGSSESRILRNAISEMEGPGIFIAHGGGDRLLDNEVRKGSLGIVIIRSTGEVLLRNRIEDQSDIGIALINGSDNLTVSENRLRSNIIGMFLAASGREDISENEITHNSVGLLLYRTGPATRIERNTMAFNTVGLKQDGMFNLGGSALSRFGVKAIEDGDGASPIIVNNLFDRNTEFDVENDASAPLYVAGNRWKAADAGTVSSGVFLPDSGWKGRVAIGTADGIAERILGHILRIALIESGYRTIDLIGMGDAGRVVDALRKRDVDIVWLSAGGISRPIGETGIDSLAIPAEEKAVAIVSKPLAERLSEPTLSALAAEIEGPLVVAAPRFLPEAERLLEAYSISPGRRGVQWADTLEEVEALLKFGAADLVVVPSLEESLTLSGFVALQDDRGAVEGEGIAIFYMGDLIERYPDLRGIITDLVPRLTTSVLHGLVSRVRLFGRLPAEVAEGFFEKGGYVE